MRQYIYEVAVFRRLDIKQNLNQIIEKEAEYCKGKLYEFFKFQYKILLKSACYSANSSDDFLNTSDFSLLDHVFLSLTFRTPIF